MPNRDGTGPEGKGPLTGKKTGNCKGSQPCNCGCRGRGLGNRACRGLGRNRNRATEEKQNA